MKKLTILLFLFLSLNATSQILDPIEWSTEVVKISDKEYDLVATATIEDGWHLYSQSVPENGPRPTTFIFESNGKYLKKGNTKEGEGYEVDDPIFEMRIKYFDTKAQFIQRIRLKSQDAFVVNGTVEYMTCNDTKCLPPKEVDLEFEINP